MEGHLVPIMSQKRSMRQVRALREETEASWKLGRRTSRLLETSLIHPLENHTSFSHVSSMKGDWIWKTHFGALGRRFGVWFCLGQGAAWDIG